MDGIKAADVEGLSGYVGFSVCGGFYCSGQTGRSAGPHGAPLSCGICSSESRASENVTVVFIIT